jgi:hypothetical protein
MYFQILKSDISDIWYLYFAGAGFDLCFAHVRKVLYHLSHASITFCSGYFGKRISFFPQTGLDSNPPILLPTIVGITSPCQVFPIDLRSQKHFLQAGLQLWYSWSHPTTSLDDRHGLLCPNIGWDGVLWTICPCCPWTMIFPVSAA